MVGNKGTLARWSWEGENAAQVDSVESLHLMERLDDAPSKAYSRTSSSPPVLSASLAGQAQEGSIVSANVILVTACRSTSPTVSVFLVAAKENRRLEAEFVGQTHTNLSGRPVDLSLLSGDQPGIFTIHVRDEKDQKVVVEVNLDYATTKQRQKLFKVVFGLGHSLSDTQHGESSPLLPKLLEPVAERQFRLRGAAPANLTIGQGGEVEVEREGEEKQILRLHHRARISTLQLLNPTPLPDLQSTGEKNCLLASGSEDGLVKIWRVSSNGWSQMGAFQCKGPAVNKVVGYEVAVGGGTGTTIGRVVVADAAGHIYCIKGWP